MTEEFEDTFTDADWQLVAEAMAETDGQPVTAFPRYLAQAQLIITAVNAMWGVINKKIEAERDSHLTIEAASSPDDLPATDDLLKRLDTMAVTGSVLYAEAAERIRRADAAIVRLTVRVNTLKSELATVETALKLKIIQ